MPPRCFRHAHLIYHSAPAQAGFRHGWEEKETPLSEIPGPFARKMHPASNAIRRTFQPPYAGQPPPGSSLPVHTASRPADRILLSFKLTPIFADE